MRRVVRSSSRHIDSGSVGDRGINPSELKPKEDA